MEQEKVKTAKCVDCDIVTNNYYTTSINSGKISRCNKCHELWVLRSTRYDLKFSEIEEK